MVHRHSHFGIYAAIRQQGNILLIRKARGPYTGMFDLPGGSPEPDETPEQTLVREVLEETGCAVTSFTSLGPVEAEFHYQTETEPGHLSHKGLLFVATIEGEPSTAADGQDSNGCVWLNPEDLNPQNATPFVHQALAKTDA
jgi:8-oxo-dGTP diphosphatase